MANEVMIHVKAKDSASAVIAQSESRFKKFGVTAGVAFAAVGAAAVKFGSASVKAYVEAQSAQVKLEDAYKRFPKLADVNISSMRKLNEELAKKTRFDDDASAAAEASLAQYKLTGDQIRELLPLVQDYAAKTGRDLPDAAKIVGKAMLGQGRALKDVGINFKDAGSAGKNFEQVTKGLRQQVGGFAEKEGKSAAGQAEILANQWGELKESVGGRLLPDLTAFVKYLNSSAIPALDAFGDSSSSTADDVAGMAKSFNKLGKVIGGKGVGRDLGEMGDEFILWKAKILGGLATVATAWAKISPVMRRPAKALREMAHAADQELQKVQGKFKETQDKINRGKVEAKIRADKKDLEAKVRDAQRRLKQTHNQKTQAKIRAEITQLQAAVARARAALASLRNRTVTITTFYQSKGTGPTSAGRKATGGPVSDAAAAGGPKANQVLVGERGPEVVQLPGGSHVFPNGNTAGMTSGRGGGGVTINVMAPNYVGAPADLLRALVDAKRRGQLDVILR